MLRNSSQATSITLDSEGMLHDGEGCVLAVSDALHSARVHTYLEWTLDQLVQLLVEIKQSGNLNQDLVSKLDSELIEAQNALEISKNPLWRPQPFPRVISD
jgi:hypothetical protein